ncbi:MAG TPA: hypothetical protein VFA26_24225, partial [Gemmataceae bacterium]|nr:hypothetical protein [Gemmataceae bacterium]
MDSAEASALEERIEQALAAGDFDAAEALAGRYRATADQSPANGDAGPARFRADYFAAQVALQAGRLEQATHRLAALQPLPRGLPPVLECRVWLMNAEVLAR